VRWSWRRGKAGTRHEERAALVFTTLVCGPADVVRALLLHLRGDVDRVPPSSPLSEFPTTIGTRTATEIVMDEDVLQNLGKGSS